MASRTLSGGAKLQQKLQELGARVSSAQTLRTGFLESATYPDGTPIAYIAAIQEWGAKNIPPRPFFRGMIAKESGHWGSDLGKLLKHSDYDAKTSLALMGEEIAGELQQAIKDFTNPPNAASTIAKKGFDKPLIYDGTMMRAVSSEVNE